jgi:hypothetical protein
MSLDPSDQPKAKKIKQPDTGLESDLKIIRTKKGKKGFPTSPSFGLDNTFGSDSIDVTNMKISTKLTKRFFDF